ncbi:MAG: hypothetical protein EP343_24640 [Deltaproteobacteria bacterium]|nr:MAG: hypothetical protein EP343_24640 [Deltaproteobacteria bacterium]
MSVYFCDKQEIAGILEHMDSSKVTTTLGTLSGITEEYDDYKDAHKPLAAFFLTHLKGPSVLPQEFEVADNVFDNTVRAFIFYMHHLLHRPKYARLRDRFESLLDRLFPLKGNTTKLGYPEEVAVAAQVHDIVTQDNDVRKLVVGTEVPALAQELALAGKNLQGLLDRATPQVDQQITYREVRNEWFRAFTDLRERVEKVVERNVRKNNLTEAKAEQIKVDLFHKIDEVANKAARRRNNAPATEELAEGESTTPETPVAPTPN